MTQFNRYFAFFDPTLHIPILVAVVLLLAVLLVAALQRARRRSEAALRGEADAARAEAETLRVRLEEREAGLEEALRRAALLERNLLATSEARAGLAAELAASEKHRREQAELLERADARLRDAFGSLSREALNKNNEMFLSLARAQLGEFQLNAEAQLEARKIAVDTLVKPIGETLGRMGAALEAAERSRTADHASFTAVQQTLAETTGRLVRALHHSAARGRWGELQLRRVVEMAGMLEHCDFEEQVTVGEAGRRQRPDLVIRLVGGRSIVVDAKAPMDSYLRAQEAESERDERELRLAHAKAVRAHMTALGGKSYWSQFERAPEFVVMFFPNEAVFAEAMRIDPGLMEHGVDNQVIPASPATLIALLRATAYGWQQERAAENARYIFDLGRRLHDRFATEYKHLAGVGAALGKAVEQFNKCVGSADRMLFPALRQFGELSEKEFFPPPEIVEAKPREVEEVPLRGDGGEATPGPDAAGAPSGALPAAEEAAEEEGEKENGVPPRDDSGVEIPEPAAEEEEPGADDVRGAEETSEAEEEAPAEDEPPEATAGGLPELSKDAGEEEAGEEDAGEDEAGEEEAEEEEGDADGVIESLFEEDIVDGEVVVTVQEEIVPEEGKSGEAADDDETPPPAEPFAE